MIWRKESLFASSYFKPNESHLINGSLSDSINHRGLNSSSSLSSPQSSTFIRSPYVVTNSDDSRQYTTPRLSTTERFGRTSELAISASGYQSSAQQPNRNLVHYVEHQDDNVISINNVKSKQAQNYDFEYDDEDDSNVIIVKSVSSSNFN